jgi:hypothetical protein
MDNVSFEFNDDGVHWDLNPDGIGVQPTIVDVSISFKFIGGSSLNGPISKLQNAVSFNFFANTEMYDDRSDRITKDGKFQEGKWLDRGVKEDNTKATAKKTPTVNESVENEKELSKSTVDNSITDEKILIGTWNSLIIELNTFNKITGTIFLDSNAKLSTDHNLKLEVNYSGNKKELGTGIIKSNEVKCEINSGIDFMSIINEALLTTKEPIFNFRCTATDLSDGTVGSNEYVWVTFDCVDQNIKANSLIMKSKYDEIMGDLELQCNGE